MIYYNEIYHYGIKRRSGRYPYGSGERPFQSRKVLKRSISKLNKANTAIESQYAIKSWMNKHPILSNLRDKPELSLSLKIREVNKEHYLKIFKDQIRAFKEAGINLNTKKSLKIHPDVAWIGTRYYINKENKK